MYGIITNSAKTLVRLFQVRHRPVPVLPRRQDSLRLAPTQEPAEERQDPEVRRLLLLPLALRQQVSVPVKSRDPDLPRPDGRDPHLVVPL